MLYEPSSRLFQDFEAPLQSKFKLIRRWKSVGKEEVGRGSASVRGPSKLQSGEVLGRREDHRLEENGPLSTQRIIG